MHILIEIPNKQTQNIYINITRRLFRQVKIKNSIVYLYEEYSDYLTKHFFYLKLNVFETMNNTK